MYNVNGNGKIIEEYLSRCRKKGNNGSYYELMRDKELLRKETFETFKVDEKGSKRSEKELEETSRLLSVCETTLYDFLEEIVRKERLFGWPKHHEPELRKRINTALQQS